MNMYVTKYVPQRRKLREEDQIFEVGKYNIAFYFDTYKEGDREYYLLKIEQFEGDKFIKSRTLYILNEIENSYGEMWESLHNGVMAESRIEALMLNTKDNQRIRYIDYAQRLGSGFHISRV